MKRFISVTVLTFIYFFIQGQQTIDKISIGHIDSIYSETLSESRKIWIYQPPGNTEIFSPKTYPVIYLLDGSAHFKSVVGMVEQLSANQLCPEMIIVAIPNTNRTRDLTPTKGDPSHPFADSTLVAASGGGDQFLEFMKKELFPYIESNYPVQSFRMLIGHSFGGLLVMHTFRHHPDLFNAYISIDPSMWWSNRQLLEEITASNKWDKNYDGKMLYVGVANTLSPGMSAEDARKDKSLNSDHFRAIMDMHDHLSSSSDGFIKYDGKYYENDDHGSVPFITEYDALRFFFDFYKMNMYPEYFMNPSLDLAAKITDHYANVSKEMNSTVLPDEAMVNNMGYNFMSMNQMDKAGKLFKLNVANYPDSFNTYDSLGDYFLAVKDNENAKKQFKKSLSLNPDSPSKSKLEKLLKELESSNK